MNSTHLPIAGTTCRARGRIIAGLACALALAGFRAVADESPFAPEPAPPPSAPAKVYNLYVGADLEVPKGESFYRMQRFVSYSAEIRVDGRAQRLPIRDLPSMRVGREMKLSRDTATFGSVKIEPAFSPGNDPFRTWSATSLAPGAPTMAGREVNPNIQQPTTGPGAPGVPSAQLQVTEYMVHDTFGNPGNDMSNTGMFMGRAELEKANGGFDAIEAEFEVSSAQPLEDCYLLLICDFKMKEKDERLQRWIHLKTLGDVTPKAHKVHFLEGGLPPGFLLVAHEFHLYAGEREIATNLSDKRIELSEDDAFTFLNLQYIGAHRGETLPPAVAWAEAPQDLADRLPPDVLRWPIYVTVDADGRVIGIAANAEGTRGAPKRVVDAIRTFRFNPALDHGKPVQGKLVLRIADFLPPQPEETVDQRTR